MLITKLFTVLALPYTLCLMNPKIMCPLHLLNSLCHCQCGSSHKLCLAVNGWLWKNTPNNRTKPTKNSTANSYFQNSYMQFYLSTCRTAPWVSVCLHWCTSILSDCLSFPSNLHTPKIPPISSSSWWTYWTTPCIHHPDQLKGWAVKILLQPGREERHVASFRSSTRHSVCWRCCFSAQRPGEPNATSVASVASAFLINCGMTKEAATSFPFLHLNNIADAGLSVMLNYTGSLVVIQWCRQIPIQDQGWTLVTKLVSLCDSFQT